MKNTEMVWRSGNLERIGIIKARRSCRFGRIAERTGGRRRGGASRVPMPSVAASEPVREGSPNVVQTGTVSVYSGLYRFSGNFFLRHAHRWVDLAMAWLTAVRLLFLPKANV